MTQKKERKKALKQREVYAMGGRHLELPLAVELRRERAGAEGAERHQSRSSQERAARRRRQGEATVWDWDWDWDWETLPLVLG
jgi:hypothetical protein